MSNPTLVSDTIEVSAAASVDWDVVVIGAGPAGAFAATLLARRGLRTLLVERKTLPRYKVCGACLNPLSLSLLESAQLAHTVADAAPLHHFHLQSRGGTLKLSLPGSVAISREQLDARLTESAIDAGADFVSGCAGKIQPLDSSQELRVFPAPKRNIELLPDGGEPVTVRASVVVAADGLTHGCLSRLDEFSAVTVSSSRLGAGTVVAEAPSFYKPGSIYMSTGKGGYVGLVRLEDGRLNVAAALDATAVNRGGSLADAACCVIESAGFPQIDALRDAAWSGTPALTRSTRPLASQRVFLIGDAAGYVEPFTGEGVAWALASATSVAPLVQRASQRWDSLLERTWNDDWLLAVGRHQGWCRRLARLLRHPAALSVLTRVVGTCPWLAAPVVRRLNRIPANATLATNDPLTARKAG
jgi:flavin-dependent dehydrogenase